MPDFNRELTKLKQIKIKSLEKRLSSLQKEYEIISYSLRTTSDAIDGVSLQRRRQNIEEYIESVSSDLEQLKREILEQSEQVNTGDYNLMNKLDVLRELNLGRIVAEQDDLLESCFIPTVALREVVSEKVDLVL